jgi:hypothetical protein
MRASGLRNRSNADVETPGLGKIVRPKKIRLAADFVYMTFKLVGGAGIEPATLAV